MKLLSIFLVLFITGCASKPVPVVPKFPEAPQQFMEPCPELKQLAKDTKLSDVARTVTENYTLYHECSIRNKAWQEWYKTQQRIFEGAR